MLRIPLTEPPPPPCTRIHPCCATVPYQQIQVAAGLDDRTVRVWQIAADFYDPPPGDDGFSGGGAGFGCSMETRECPGDPVRFVGHREPVFGVSWTSDGRFLLSAGGDGVVVLWDMERGKAGTGECVVRYACHR